MGPCFLTYFVSMQSRAVKEDPRLAEIYLEYWLTAYTPLALCVHYTFAGYQIAGPITRVSPQPAVHITRYPTSR